MGGRGARPPSTHPTPATASSSSSRGPSGGGRDGPRGWRSRDGDGGGAADGSRVVSCWQASRGEWVPMVVPRLQQQEQQQQQQEQQQQQQTVWSGLVQPSPAWLYSVAPRGQHQPMWKWEIAGSQRSHCPSRSTHPACYASSSSRRH